MQRIILLQGGLDDLEVAVLKLSSDEHKELKDKAVDFFNRHKVFCTEKISKVELQHYGHVKGDADSVVIAVHYPHCAVVGTCAPQEVPSAKA